MPLPLASSLVDAEQLIQDAQFEAEHGPFTFYPGSDKVGGINYDDISFSYQYNATYAFGPGYQNLIFGGQYWGHNYNAALMFRDVIIPQNAMVTRAYIQFKAGNSVGPFNPPLKFRIRASKTIKPKAPMAVEQCLGLKLTDACEYWGISEAHVADQWYESADFTSVIQELIGLDGWSLMHNILLVIQYLSGVGWTSLVSMDAPAPIGAQLKIYYRIK